jgi:general secretion pathway protein D
MKHHLTFSRSTVLLLALLMTAPVYAQFFPGQFGGGGSSRSRGSSASTRSYPNNSTVGDALITVDPDSRSLIVIADDETSLHISQVISNLDRPKPQVLIKVVFVELTHNDGMDIGVEGGFRQPVSGGSTAGMGSFANAFGLGGLNSSTNTPLNALGQPLTALNPAPPGAGLYQVLGQDYQVTIRAIAEAGRAKVLSRPSILARNSQPATILVGQTVPLITSVRYDSLGQAINGITYTDVGIILRVTPFITTHNMVEMIVQPEISSVSETEKVQIQEDAFAPVIDKRSADTVVVTPDGQTVVIGGLIQNAKASSESKIPVLGDIPVLGNLFKRRITAEKKTELLIFLTPHIVEAASDLAHLTIDEQKKVNMKKAVTPEEMDRFLDSLPTAPTNSLPGAFAPVPPEKNGNSRNR